MKGEKEEKSHLVADEDKKILTKILLSLACAKKGQELLMKSSNMMQEVVMTLPSLQKLSEVFGISSNFNPLTIAEAKMKTKYPQCFANFNPLFVPKSLKDSKHQCLVCGKILGSWVGADSHIRKIHSKIFYGPCPKCFF